MIYTENIPISIAVVVILTLVFSFMIAKYRHFVKRLAQVRSLVGQIGMYPVKNLDRFYQEISRRQFIMIHLGYYDHWPVEKLLKNPLEGFIKGFRVVYFDFRSSIKKTHFVWQSNVAVVGDDNEFAKFVLFPQKLGNVFSPLRIIKSSLARISDVIGGYCRIEDLVNGYVILCPERSAEQVRCYFNADIIAYFSKHQTYVIEGSGNHLLVYRKHQLIPADQVTSFINEAIDIRQRFEKSVTDSAVRDEGYPISGATQESQAVPL